MASQEQLERLQQGPDSWNDWRRENAGLAIDLQNAVLNDASLDHVDLRHVNLHGAQLRAASLRYANLTGATLVNADLRHTMMRYAVVRNADLRNANLIWGILRDVDFTGSNLTGAYLYSADLQAADFAKAMLDRTSLQNAYLGEANLAGATIFRALFGLTHFGDTNLTDVVGLHDCQHILPSYLDHQTLHRSGSLPLSFLPGCGLSDWEIEVATLYQPLLSEDELTSALYRIHDLRGGKPIQVRSLFISYSHADARFVDYMETYLNAKGIRFWRDVHHATAGRLETQIERAIRLNPTVLLILSKHSVQSDWVEHEARLARNLELETSRDVLCPIALDDSWRHCRWPQRLREQIMEYNILDFSTWNNEDDFRLTFTRLIDGLDLFYKT